MRAPPDAGNVADRCVVEHGRQLTMRIRGLKERASVHTHTRTLEIKRYAFFFPQKKVSASFV